MSLLFTFKDKLTNEFALKCVDYDFATERVSLQKCDRSTAQIDVIRYKSNLTQKQKENIAKAKLKNPDYISVNYKYGVNKSNPCELFLALTVGTSVIVASTERMDNHEEYIKELLLEMLADEAIAGC